MDAFAVMGIGYVHILDTRSRTVGWRNRIKIHVNTHLPAILTSIPDPLGESDDHIILSIVL